MNTLWQDLRYGVRMLIRKPGLTLVAVVTLALGIGANTTIFSFVNGVLLRPLPYPEQERLAVIWETVPERGVTSMGASLLNFLDWRERNRVFEDMGLWFGAYLSLTGDGEPEQLTGARVSHGVFEILRVSPVLGRTFTVEEDRPGQDAVVILSHGLWQQRFDGDLKIVGQKIIVNHSPRTVIGVMPPGFTFPDTRSLWIPLALRREGRETRLSQARNNCTAERWCDLRTGAGWE
ncbi:MAG: ABC transporter permease [Pyrinomonadaceae bacterium]